METEKPKWQLAKVKAGEPVINHGKFVWVRLSPPTECWTIGIIDKKQTFGKRHESNIINPNSLFKSECYLLPIIMVELCSIFAYEIKFLTMNQWEQAIDTWVLMKEGARLVDEELHRHPDFRP